MKPFPGLRSERADNTPIDSEGMSLRISPERRSGLLRLPRAARALVTARVFAVALVVSCAPGPTQPGAASAPQLTPGNRAAPSPAPSVASASAPQAAPIGTVRESIPEPLTDVAASTGPLPPLPNGVAHARGGCGARVATRRARCGDREGALDGLAMALSATDPQQRDTYLAMLEDCAGFPVAFVRTLRADLDRQCADVLAAPLLAAPPQGISADMLAALLGLSLAARYERANAAMPHLGREVTPEKVDAFIAGPFTAWVEKRTSTLTELARRRAPGPSYGALQAQAAEARAWASLASEARSAPIPDEVRKNTELRNRYYVAIDAHVAAARTRAIELAPAVAELVASEGSLDPAVLAWARSLGVLHPEAGQLRTIWQAYLPVPPEEGDAGKRIEASLPSFYAGLVVDTAALAEPRRLRALVSNGLSPVHRRALRDAALTPAQRALVGYYFTAAALRTLSPALAAEAERVLDGLDGASDSAKFWLALSRTLTASQVTFSGWVAVARPRVAPGPLRELAESSGVEPSLRGLARIDAAIVESAGDLDDARRARIRDDLQRVNVLVGDALRPCENVFGSPEVFEAPRPSCPYPSLL